MRFRGIVFTLLAFAGTATLFLGFVKAQAPPAGTPPAKTASASAGGASRPVGTLSQVMRGIMFPNSNVVFFAQSNDPAAVKPAADPTTAIDPLAGMFGGWAAVESSGIAIAEGSVLLSTPGRLCSNGRPVPLKNADWPKFVQGLRTAGINVYKAAQAKDKNKLSDAADTLAGACMDCHTKYRDLPGGAKDHCM